MRIDQINLPDLEACHDGLELLQSAVAGELLVRLVAAMQGLMQEWRQYKRAAALLPPPCSSLSLSNDDHLEHLVHLRARPRDEARAPNRTVRRRTSSRRARTPAAARRPTRP